MLMVLVAWVKCDMLTDTGDHRHARGRTVWTRTENHTRILYCFYITPPHATPTRPAVLSWHLHRLSLSPPTLHGRTQPGHRTQASPRLRNAYLRKPRTDLRRRQPIHTRLSRTSWNWTPQWDKSLHHDTQPSPPGSHRSKDIDTIRGIPHIHLYWIYNCKTRVYLVLEL
jgi:hypothetical protein